MADSALYLEVDEDITSAIDKLRKAPGPSVQIVVPKRSGILQSIINLKLLKKAAEDAGKELVLVTGDKVASDLAGRIGIPVAASIGARPVITEPRAAKPRDDSDDVIEADDPAPAGDLIDLEEAVPVAAAATAKPTFSRRDIDKPRPEPKVEEPVGKLVQDEPTDTKPSALKPDKSSAAAKVPSFSKLQRRLAWVGLAVFVIAGYMVGMYFLSSANVKLFAVGTKVSVDGTFALDTAATTSDTDNGVLAAQEVTYSKDLTAPVTPTGQKDDGTKAGGTMTISNCYDSNPHTFVAGTRFTAPDGKVFRSNSGVVVPGGSGSFLGCTTPGTVTVSVSADQNGDSYNEAPATYAIPGLPASETTGSNSISAKGGQMSGGTSKISTVVTQADVDKAQADALAKDKDASTTAVTAKVPSDSHGFADSLQVTPSAITPSPAVGTEATTATVSLKVTYTLLAAKKTDYSKYVKTIEQKQIGDNNQIYDDGLGAAQIASTGKDSAGRAGFHFSAVAYGGAKLDQTAIANQLKGKKYGDASTLASGLPGVDHVEINVWPAWSASLPKRANKIHVTVSVASNK